MLLGLYMIRYLYVVYSIYRSIKAVSICLID